MIKRTSLLVLIILVSLAGTSLAAEVELKSVSTVEIENLKLDVGGADIKFDENRTGILLSSDLKVKKKNNTLYISAPQRHRSFSWFRKAKQNYRLVIGTGRPFSRVEINAGGAEIRGKLTAQRIAINGGGLQLATDLTAELIEINGGGVEITGRMEACQIEINGAGLDVELEVADTEKIELSGVGIAATFKYIDAWTGERSLEVSGVGGSVKLSVPAANEAEESGRLNVKKDGLIEIEVKQY